MSRRERTKFPALKPELNLKTRFDLIDMDEKYWADLKKDPKAMEYLNSFNEEFVNASFKKGKKHLHKTKNQRRDSYNRNNARNRCIYTREKAQGKLDYIEDLKVNMEQEFIEYEDKLIESIDDNKLFDEKINNFKKGSNGSDSSSDV